MTPERVGAAIAYLIIFGPIAYGLYRVWVDATWQQKFLAILERGDRVRARKLLDRRAKARKPGKMIRRKGPRLRQRARVLGLWMLGELEEVRAELARPQAGGAYLANVQMFGMLALATEPGDHTGIAVALEDLAGTVTAETTRLARPDRVLADILAKIGAGLEGRPVTDADARPAMARHFIERHLTKVLLLRVLLVGAERTGKSTARLQGRLAALTRRFAPARDVA